MKTCSPGGSVTTIFQTFPDPPRAIGCADTDQPLKSPTTDTDFAPIRVSENVTPSGVVTGALAAGAQHTVKAEIARTSMTALRKRVRIATADYGSRIDR